MCLDERIPTSINLADSIINIPRKPLWFSGSNKKYSVSDEHYAQGQTDVTKKYGKGTGRVYEKGRFFI